MCVCVCVCKFEARLLISASEWTEFGRGVGGSDPPAERHNASVMRVSLIEMYGPRLTAFQCYTNSVLSWQKGTSDVHQGIYSVIRKTIYGNWRDPVV